MRVANGMQFSGSIRSLTPFVTGSLAIGMVLSLSAQATEPTEPVIYGDDDRKDLYSVTDSRELELAASTVALMPRGNLQTNGDRVDVKANKFGERMGLCATERFYEQPSGAFCSGSLVGEDLVITAGHCIENQTDCDKTQFVFDYAITTEGEFPTSVPKDSVVGCQSIVAHKLEHSGADYAVVRLDRKITQRKPLRLNRVSDLKVGDRIGVIGHPSGLPTKVAFGESNVRNVDAPGFFVSNLDTYGGNSGSAVFNATTGLIEGILVRGERDFVRTPLGCMASYTCAADACRGEDVTKISEVLSSVPEPRRSPSSKWPTLGRGR